MPPLSATIITRNEAKHIARAIRSLAGADEIIIVDAGSTDGTQQIARDLGARVSEHAWQGFAAQKNFATAQATHDWILSLDVDEELNADAQAALARWTHLQASAKQPTIGKLIDDAMLAIEAANPSLKGVLSKDYNRPALDKMTVPPTGPSRSPATWVHASSSTLGRASPARRISPPPRQPTTGF